MNKIQGKGLALAGSIVSTTFSALGVILIVTIKSIVNHADFRLTSLDGAQVKNPNITAEEAIEMTNTSNIEFNIIMNAFIVFLVIFIVLGIVGIILSRKVNSKNKVAVGATFIILAFIHVLFARFIAAVLLLIAGIMILTDHKSNRTIKTGFNSDYFKESEQSHFSTYDGYSSDEERINDHSTHTTSEYEMYHEQKPEGYRKQADCDTTQEYVDDPSPQDKGTLESDGETTQNEGTSFETKDTQDKVDDQKPIENQSTNENLDHTVKEQDEY